MRTWPGAGWSPGVKSADAPGPLVRTWGLGKGCALPGHLLPQPPATPLSLSWASLWGPPSTQVSLGVHVLTSQEARDPAPFQP